MIATRLLKRVAVFTIACAAGFAVCAPAAFAYTWNGTNAASYAHKWSSNTSTLRNGDYDKFSNDCANFVSQSLRAGGMPNDTSGGNVWSYNSHWYGDTHTTSWTVALDLVNYLKGSGRGTVDSLSHNMTDRYTSARKGDVYAYEWGDDDGHLDHVSLSSGWGDFADYYDSGKAKNYRSVTGGLGDYMSQHTHDRDYAPWNWGYWTERDVTTRSKMLTWVVHVS